MGNTDSLPVVSQMKSLVQFIGGDSEGAERTQLNFVKGCPLISQGVALGAAIKGNKEYAQETQLYFVQNMSNVADSIPVVGHVKGGIHYICGDKDGGDNAMKAASRTVFVAGGGIGGFFLLGPVGAVAGGIAGGAVGDGTITGVESAVEKKYRPYGHLHNIKRAIDGDLDIGGGFDWVATFVFDGLAGRGFAQLFKNFKAASIENSNFREQIHMAVRRGNVLAAEAGSVFSLTKVLQIAVKQLLEAMKTLGPESIPEEKVGNTCITVEYCGYVIYAVMRCDGCQEVVKRVNMGPMKTYTITLANDEKVPLDNVFVRTAMELLQKEEAKTCDCETEKTRKKEKKPFDLV